MRSSPEACIFVCSCKSHPELGKAWGEMILGAWEGIRLMLRRSSLLYGSPPDLKAKEQHQRVSVAPACGFFGASGIHIPEAPD